mgnify:CR=1 FL=1
MAERLGLATLEGKLEEAGVRENIQQKILAKLESMDQKDKDRIFAGLELYIAAITPQEIEKAAQKLYYEYRLQYLLLTLCELNDTTCKKILSAFAGVQLAALAQT